MLNRSRFLSRPSLLGLAVSACLITPLALAAGSTDDHSNNPEARYQADVQLCNSGQSDEGKATCLKEAGAALEAARQHRLSMGSNQQYSKNRTQRCEAMSGQERDDCMLQMSGQDTTTTGSVGAGGILRETTITTPAPMPTQEAPILEITPSTASPSPHSPYPPVPAPTGTGQ